MTLSLKEYVRLRQADDWKDAVQAAGVDNWPGYGDIWSEGPPLEEEEIIAELIVAELDHKEAEKA